MKVTLDGNDNSVTINESLYNALLQCGVCTDNRIFVYKFDGQFAFSVCPKAITNEQTQFAHLQVNNEFKTIGFETLNPSVNRMLYEWGMEAGTICHNVTVKYKNINGLVDCFVIKKPNKAQCEVRTVNPY